MQCIEIQRVQLWCPKPRGSGVSWHSSAGVHSAAAVALHGWDVSLRHVERFLHGLDLSQVPGGAGFPGGFGGDLKRL